MDSHTTMFESVNESSPDFVIMNELSPDADWIQSPNISSSTLLSSYLDPTDIYMSSFDPNVSSEETDLKSLDDYHELFDDRWIQAIEYLNERCITDSEILVQIWLPVIINGKRVLSTENQPFMVNSGSKNLSNYREISKIHHFAVDFDSNEMTGLPGQVFLKTFPTCTPYLQFIAEGNDPRVNYAQKFDIFGCLNLPVFELDGETCLGVMEIVTTSQKVNFHDELENIFKALEVVDLTSSDFLIHPKLKDFNEPYEVVLAEIRDILRSICETLTLPLAQTWGPHKTRFDSISIIESASYVFDPQILGFFEACSLQQLLKGEGTAGKAWGTTQPCFANIDDFCRADFDNPLAHEAKMFGISSGVAIRVHSNYTGPLDFILEFYLPRDCIGNEEQNQMQKSILSMIKSLSWSLHVVVNDEDLVKVDSIPVKETNTRKTHDESWISDMLEAQKRGENVILSMGSHKKEPEEEFHVMNAFYQGLTFCEAEKQTYIEWGSKSISQTSGTKKSTRVKTERNISLQDLQQYFPGSLKDAAKSIGVCPTTLKRICRQHGIMRWPSRKIKKVSHSLKKLQLVIDSVQGTDGMIKLGSFYTNFAEPKVNSRVNLLKSQTTPSNSSSSCSRFPADIAKETENVIVRSEKDKLVENNCSPFRVKASYGDEKIRFKMGKNWGFGDLQGEIKRRFNIYDMGSIILKYIDDESEWVLLACDDDLEECMDLHASTKNQTVKLFLHQALIHPNDDVSMWQVGSDDGY